MLELHFQKKNNLFKVVVTRKNWPNDVNNAVLAVYVYDSNLSWINWICGE